jgi:hypothetical protein
MPARAKPGAVPIKSTPVCGFCQKRKERMGLVAKRDIIYSRFCKYCKNLYSLSPDENPLSTKTRRKAKKTINNKRKTINDPICFSV